MIARPGLAVAAGALVTAGAVAGIDLASKAHARAAAPTVGEVDDPPVDGLRWVHHEHAGPRALGLAVAGVPIAVGAGAAYGITRLGGSRTLAVLGATALGVGAALNGAELLARGSNTNPWSAWGKRFNAADLAIAGGVGALALGSVPIVVRALAR